MEGPGKSFTIGTVDVNLLFRELDEKIASVEDRDDILQLCLDRIISLLNADRGFIVLYNHEKGELEAHACHNVDEELLFIGETISLTILNMAFIEEKPVLISDALADPAFAQKTSIILSELRSVICVPIATEKGIYGLIYVDNRMKIGLYEEEHLRFLSACAEQLARIINEHLREIQPRERT